MSSVPVRDAESTTRFVDTFARTENNKTVETQAVAVVNPGTGLPVDFASEASLQVIQAAAYAIQLAVESMNAKVLTDGDLRELPLNVVSVLRVPKSMSVVSQASANETLVQALPTTIFNMLVRNTGGSTAYIKLYNLPNWPSIGTDSPQMTFAVPASGFLPVNFGSLGHHFSAGLSLIITGGEPDTDTTNAEAGKVKILLSFE